MESFNELIAITEKGYKIEISGNKVQLSKMTEDGFVFGGAFEYFEGTPVISDLYRVAADVETVIEARKRNHPKFCKHEMFEFKVGDKVVRVCRNCTGKFADADMVRMDIVLNNN